jgi:hypothetical protein
MGAKLKFCVCGFEVRKLRLPDDVATLYGKRFIWSHVESGDTRCYPDSTNEVDNKATVQLEEAE